MPSHVQIVMGAADPITSDQRRHWTALEAAAMGVVDVFDEADWRRRASCKRRLRRRFSRSVSSRSSNNEKRSSKQRACSSSCSSCWANAAAMPLTSSYFRLSFNCHPVSSTFRANEIRSFSIRLLRSKIIAYRVATTAYATSINVKP